MSDVIKDAVDTRGQGGAAGGERAEAAPSAAGGRPGPWRRGLVLTVCALLLGLLLVLHSWITDRAGLGSLVETFLPWFGVFVPVLLAAALWRRSASAVVALLLPAVAWVSLFGGLLMDKTQAGGDLMVVSHNVAAENTDPAGTARQLAGSGADLLALEELSDQARGTYEKELARAYPHHTVQGTVGLWSKLPLSDTRPVDVLRDNVGPLARERERRGDAPVDPPRALRTTVATAKGPLAVYVAHLGSVRVMPRGGFWTESRDAGAAKLAEAVAAEKSERVVVLGDMNGTTDDRALTGLTSRLTSAQTEAGDGLGLSWPASFPLARIDQILLKGVTARSSWVLPETGSDHLPVGAWISW